MQPFKPTPYHEDLKLILSISSSRSTLCLLLFGIVYTQYLFRRLDTA
jgi:hypothetical protein